MSLKEKICVSALWGTMGPMGYAAHYTHRQTYLLKEAIALAGADHYGADAKDKLIQMYNEMGIHFDHGFKAVSPSVSQLEKYIANHQKKLKQ